MNKKERGKIQKREIIGEIDAEWWKTRQRRWMRSNKTKRTRAEI
jgi:hypothetical protein